MAHRCIACGFTTEHGLVMERHICSYPPQPYHPTRREYFAAAAMNGLISGQHYKFSEALVIADRMIELLDAKEEK